MSTVEVVPMTVQQALAAVMGAVQAVGKEGRNTHQNYNFRGIDAVVNAVGPALRHHGVLVLPSAESVEYETYKSTNGAMMTRCVVKVRFTFVGPAGDTLECCTYGESSDSGDKSTPKAHSVAFRTALLQALCIPTDEPDSDAFSHERAADDERPIPAQGWPTLDQQHETWERLFVETKAIPDDADRELVQGWVKAQGFRRSSFTATQADQWQAELDNAIPAVDVESPVAVV